MKEAAEAERVRLHKALAASKVGEVPGLWQGAAAWLGTWAEQGLRRASSTYGAGRKSRHRMAMKRVAEVPGLWQDAVSSLGTWAEEGLDDGTGAVAGSGGRKDGTAVGRRVAE
eukprot:869547-Prymnesium_polylepis.1